jgi:hypothetical protein
MVGTGLPVSLHLVIATAIKPMGCSTLSALSTSLKTFSFIYSLSSAIGLLPIYPLCPKRSLALWAGHFSFKPLMRIDPGFIRQRLIQKPTIIVQVGLCHHVKTVLATRALDIELNV